MATDRAVNAAQELLSPDTPSVVAAAGATQGGATALVQLRPKMRVLVTVTLSSQGIKLPAPVAAGQELTVFAPIAKGVKIYPHSNGQINATATNTAVALVLNKANTYVAQDLNVWRVQAGA